MKDNCQFFFLYKENREVVSESKYPGKDVIVTVDEDCAESALANGHGYSNIATLEPFSLTPYWRDGEINANKISNDVKEQNRDPEPELKPR